MFQLLIVDDEPSVVDAIAQTIPWNKVSISEVYCAYSAKEALKIVERDHIDIVMTDIRMPGMDGIQLMETVRKRSVGTRFILLTGYAEFDYAKQALQLEAADYLLKPVSDEKLMEAVGNVTWKLKQEWEQISSYQRTLEVLRHNLPSLRADLLRDLLEGRRYGDELSDKLSVLDVPFEEGDRLRIVLIRLEGEFSHFNGQDRYLMEYSIINMAEEIMAPYFHIWYCRDHHDFLVLMLRPRLNRDIEELSVEFVSRLAIQLQNNVLHYLHGNVSVVVGNQGCFPDDLVQIYQLAVKTMRRRIGINVGLLMTVSNQSEPTEIHSLTAIHEPPSLIHLFEAGIWEEARRKLHHVFNELESKWDGSPELTTELYHTILAACYHYAHTNGKTLPQLLSVDGEERDIPKLETLTSIKAMKEWAFETCDRLSQENSAEIQDVRNALIKQVQEYIHVHLAEDVSLQTLADQVNLHPVYLSKVFKLETGEGLKEYLFRLRMEKAAYLLKHSHLKIFEVTAQVGYLNTSYFIKVFKRHFGMTPQDYRDTN